MCTKHIKKRVKKHLFRHSEDEHFLRFPGPHSRSMSPTPSGVSAQAISVKQFFQSLHFSQMIEAMDLRIQSVRPANGGSVSWSTNKYLRGSLAQEKFKCFISQTGIDKHLFC